MAKIAAKTSAPAASKALVVKNDSPLSTLITEELTASVTFTNAVVTRKGRVVSIEEDRVIFDYKPPRARNFIRKVFPASLIISLTGEPGQEGVIRIRENVSRVLYIKSIVDVKVDGKFYVITEADGTKTRTYINSEFVTTDISTPLSSEKPEGKAEAKVEAKAEGKKAPKAIASAPATAPAKAKKAAAKVEGDDF